MKRYYFHGDEVPDIPQNKIDFRVFYHIPSEDIGFKKESAFLAQLKKQNISLTNFQWHELKDSQNRIARFYSFPRSMENEIDSVVDNSLSVRKIGEYADETFIPKEKLYFYGKTNQVVNQKKEESKLTDSDNKKYIVIGALAVIAFLFLGGKKRGRKR